MANNRNDYGNDTAGANDGVLHFVNIGKSPVADMPMREICRADPGVFYYQVVKGSDPDHSDIAGYVRIGVSDMKAAAREYESHFKAVPDIRIDPESYNIDEADGGMLVTMTSEGVFNANIAHLKSDPVYAEGYPWDNNPESAYNPASLSMFDIPESFSRRCIEIEGRDYQDMCLIEECSEVVKEITKIRRKESRGKAYLEEEIGDLFIVLQTAIINHNLDPEAIRRSMIDKISRTEELFSNMETEDNA